METKFQNSFIPKRPIVGSSPNAAAKAHHPINLIGTVATGVFLLAVLATGGIFAYERYLTGTISGMEQELAAAKQSLETELLNEFIRLDTRMKSAEQLISSHTATSLIFDYLQNNTVRSVRFDDFSYVVSDLGTIDVVLNGRAESYNALALQSDIFNQNRYIRNAVFSDMNLDESGNVVFLFRATVDPELVAHRNSLDEFSFMFNREEQ